MIQTFRKFWPAAMLAALFLGGCDGTSNPVETPASGEPPASRAATGTVNLKVQFPVKQLQKALVDERATLIQVEWLDAKSYQSLGSVDLVPDATTGIAQAQIEVPTGMVAFSARAFEQVPDPWYPSVLVPNGLEEVSTVGVIVEGTNSVYLTFLVGDWLLVDASDNPLPLTVGTGGSSRTLAGFSLAGMYQPGYDYATAAKIDVAKPAGWGDYFLQWYTDGAAPLGPQMEGAQAAQFDGATGVNRSSFWGEWLNLTDPAATEGVNYGWATPYFPTGDRLLLILDFMEPESTITDELGNDMVPVIDGAADSQVLDGTHITGHMLEMTAESFTRTLTQANIDCAPYWGDDYVYAAGAARAAAIRDQLARSTPRAGKATPGDSSILYSGTISSPWEECYSQPWATDGDGDGDMASDWLSYDMNGDGAYDPLDDGYDDYNGDGNYDWVIYNQVDGDGDGDMVYEDLTKDVNYNGRYDAADGDMYQDSDGDGKFDYVYTPGDLYTEVEQFSNLVVHEFRAKGSQAVTRFTPPLTGGWYLGVEFNEPTVVTFLDSSRYIMAEDGYPDIDPVTGAVTGGPGMEYGTYTYDPATGAITATATANTNGDWGLAGSGTDTMNLAFTSLNTIKGSDPADPADTFALNRVISGWEPIVGSWKIEDPFGGGVVVMSFLPNGQYLIAGYSGALDLFSDGMERGSYWLNYLTEGKYILNATGISSTMPAGEEYFSVGLSASVQIEINGNTLTWTDGESTLNLTRVH